MSSSGEESAKPRAHTLLNSSLAEDERLFWAAPPRKFEPGRCSTFLTSDSSGSISTALPSRYSSFFVCGTSYRKSTRSVAAGPVLPPGPWPLSRCSRLSSMICRSSSCFFLHSSILRSSSALACSAFHTASWLLKLVTCQVFLERNARDIAQQENCLVHRCARSVPATACWAADRCSRSCRRARS